MADVAVPLDERRVRTAGEPHDVSFPELVWTHFKWEQDLHADRPVDPQVEARYRTSLKAFEREHGSLLDAYWSTTCASAVAVTIKHAPPPLCWLGEDPTLRVHR